MPSGRAARLCPEAIVLPARTRLYTQVSAGILKVLCRFGENLEPTSVDEAYLDLSDVPGGYFGAARAGREIRRSVRREFGVPASVGIAPTKAIAKIASNLAKPDGLEVIPPDKVPVRIHPMPVETLGGVGEKTAASLRSTGIRTIGDLAAAEDSWLRRHFGKHGARLGRMARGEPGSGVTPFRATPDPKSMSNETTLRRNTADRETIESHLLALAEKLARRLRREELLGDVFHCKLRFPDFRTLMRSQTLAEPTNDERTLFLLAREMLARHAAGRELRLVGIGLSRLSRTASAGEELDFDHRRRRYRESLAVFDEVRDRFGERSLKKARLL